MSRVANRYGKALFQIALEKNKIDLVASDLSTVKDLIQQNIEFRDLLINPLISVNEKLSVLTKLFIERVDSLTYQFLHLLCSKKRSNILLEVIDRFYLLLYDYKGILKGEIISAQPLQAEQVDTINKQVAAMTGKIVELDVNTDESLLAGFIVKVKDTIIDMSVKNQLEKLREKLIYT